MCAQRPQQAGTPSGGDERGPEPQAAAQQPASKQAGREAGRQVEAWELAAGCPCDCRAAGTELSPPSPLTHTHTHTTTGGAPGYQASGQAGRFSSRAGGAQPCPGPPRPCASAVTLPQTVEARGRDGLHTDWVRTLVITHSLCSSRASSQQEPHHLNSTQPHPHNIIPSSPSSHIASSSSLAHQAVPSTEPCHPQPCPQSLITHSLADRVA